MAERVALVTGVSSGTGSAVAGALSEHGWRVFGTVRSEASSLPKRVERAREGVRASVYSGDDPALVTEAVLRASTECRPRLRHPVGKRAGLLARLRRFAPASVLDSGLRKQFRL